MKLTKSLLAAFAAVLGLAGAATAYQLTSAPASTVRPASQTSSDDDKVAVVVPKIEQGTQFQWAPCEPPAVQQGDACVVEQVQTVVVDSGSSSGGGSPSGGGHSDDADNDSGDDSSQDDDSDDDSYEDDDSDEDDDEDEDDEDEDDEDEDEPEDD